MRTSYPVALASTLEFEGGYADDPRDPGGATNRGVTHRVYDAWRKARGLRPRDVRQITDAEVAAIYRALYWNKVEGDKLPAGPDLTTFDAGVNSGPARGAKWLQQAMRIRADGVVGPLTIQTALDHPDKAALTRAICRLRLGFMQALRIWKTFGRGWARRVARMEALGVGLALAATGLAGPQIAAEAEAEAAKAGAEAKKETAGAGTGGVGGAAGASQVDPSQGFDATNVAIGIGLVILAVVIGYLIWRRVVARERAKAYAAAAAAGRNR